LIETLLSILKPIDAPGSIPFLVLCMVIGLAVILFWPSRRRLAQRGLVAIGVLYLVLALPWTARAIAGGLPPPRHATLTAPDRLDALIVFDGDNRRGRLQTTARVFAQSHPREVWVLGGRAAWLFDELPAVGVPASVRRLDPAPLNTRDQMAWVSEHQRQHPEARIAIVASRLQVPRIDGMARAAGLSVPLMPSPIDTEPPTAGAALLVPVYSALRVSRDALYEHAALVYYHHHGWAVR
jgi:uncharacterized SAM-binding protein YcdF (DUF218 family)